MEEPMTRKHCIVYLIKYKIFIISFLQKNCKLFGLKGNKQYHFFWLEIRKVLKSNFLSSWTWWANRSLSQRQVWSTELIPGLPGLHGDLVLKNKTTCVS